MNKARLDKFLSNAHVGTRSEVKKYIKQERVKVNGKVITDPSYYITSSDVVTFDGEKIVPHHNVYIILYKPAGFVSTTSEREPSVMNLIVHPYIKELHIAGRLDKDVEGLLILTNDGEFTHKVISPKSYVEKEYIIQFQNQITVTEHMKNMIQEGLYIHPGIKTLPGKIEQVDERTVSIIIVEGKYHQIKRMCAALGLSSWKKITRIRIGNLTLHGLEKGEWKEIEKKDIECAIFG
ncbi:MAG: pseudouridine synthase [Fervidobacterium sp.]